LTQDIPKPMLKVRGRPILEHIIEGIRSAGVRQFCIITGYRAQVVEAYFGDGSRFGLQIQYARQVVQDGTGRAAELASDFVGPEDFLLTYGDILVRPETYPAMLRRFQSGPFAGLTTVTAGQDVGKGGLNFFDENFRLLRIVEKPSPAELEQFRREGLLKTGEPVWYNAGIYIFRPDLFEFTTRLEKSPRGEYELPDAINAMLQAGRTIAGLPIEGRWVDVRDPEVLADLEREQ
jgi:dTDP-glucose pyrophosphorylase